MSGTACTAAGAAEAGNTAGAVPVAAVAAAEVVVVRTTGWRCSRRRIFTALAYVGGLARTADAIIHKPEVAKGADDLAQYSTPRAELWNTLIRRGYPKRFGYAFTGAESANMSLWQNVIDLEALNSSLGGSSSGPEWTLNSSSNVTVSSDGAGDGPTAMALGEGIIFAILMACMIIATLFGNTLVVLSVFTYRPLRSVQNFFIVSLAVADMAVAALVMPFNVVNFILGYWIFGPTFCYMWLTFDVMCCTASIFNLSAIAMDRYYAIHDPINYAQKRTLKRVMIMIAIVWGASAIIAIPPLVGWNNWSDMPTDTKMVCMLTDEKAFVIYSASGSFFVPLFIMTFVYIKIFQATRRRLRERRHAAAAARLNCSAKPEQGPNNKPQPPCQGEVSSTETPDETLGSDNPSMLLTNETVCTNLNNGDGSNVRLTSANNNAKAPTFQVHQFLEEKQRISLSRERRAARTLAIIMAVFVLCWLPFFLMYVIFPFCQSCAETDERVINFIVWLGYINSTLNPIIYTIFNLDFRRAFKKILFGKCPAAH